MQHVNLYTVEPVRFPVTSDKKFRSQNISLTFFVKPEALKSLYRSPGYKKNQLVLCKNYVLQW
jgi:hypothetical protein